MLLCCCGRNGCRSGLGWHNKATQHVIRQEGLRVMQGRYQSQRAYQGSLSPQSMLTGTVTAASCSSGSGPVL